MYLWQRQTNEFSYEDGKEIERWANGERMEHIAMIYHTHSWFINIEITNKIHGSFLGQSARNKITYAIRFGCVGNPSVRFILSRSSFHFYSVRSQMSVSISDCDVDDDAVFVCCACLLRHSIASSLFIFSNFIWSRKAITNVRIKSFGHGTGEDIAAVKQDVKTSSHPAPNTPPVTLFCFFQFWFRLLWFAVVHRACRVRVWDADIIHHQQNRLCMCACSSFGRSSRYHILSALFRFHFWKIMFRRAWAK